VRKICLAILLVFQIGCSSGPVATILPPFTPSKPTSTPTITLTPTITWTPTKTPTATEKPLSGKFCEPDEVNRAIEKLIKTSGTDFESIETATPTISPTPEPSGTPGSQKLTDAQRLEIVGAIIEKKLELELINIPPCLDYAKQHLANSFDKMMEFFGPHENDKSEDILGILIAAGFEQQYFESEIKRIQRCLASGCPELTATPVSFFELMATTTSWPK